MPLTVILVLLVGAAFIVAFLAVGDELPLERKLAAKRLNERVKLLATSLNAAGLGVLGAATIVPIVGQTSITPSETPPSVWTGLLAYAVLLSLALMTYRFMRSED